MPKSPKLRPFVKWVGGKTEKITEIMACLSDPAHWPSSTVYYEPFLGGGSLFLALRERGFKGRAVLSDTNAELIALWTMVRDDPEELISVVADYLTKYVAQSKAEQKRAYGLLRDDFATLTPDHAALLPARTLLLNRLGFNGLYRVNADGTFNVPWGGVKKPVGKAKRVAGFQPGVIRAVSAALQGVEIRCADFREVLPLVSSADVLFADPPYTPIGPDTSEVAPGEVRTVKGFVGYTPGGFGPDDHRMLLDRTTQARDAGALVILANEADVDTVAAYAHAGLIILRGSERRSVNANGKRRGPVPTLLAVGFPARTIHYTVKEAPEYAT